MNKPKTLMILDREDANTLDSNAHSNHWDIHWKTLDYSRLKFEIESIRDVLKREKIPFVVYSRNDQVADRIQIGPVTRKLKIGYTSISAIDDSERTTQLKTCFEDFLACNRKFNFEPETPTVNEPKSMAKGTFSLVFDVEQLGCVRFGFPRINQILNKHGVKATFFITNLINKVYPSFAEALENMGHEIGLHGMYHEYLSDNDSKDQENSVRQMKKDLSAKVIGANFLGRMDKLTVTALAKNRIDYFVHDGINYYKPFAYPKIPVNPVLISSEEGNVWLLPISVETYDLPWFSIKNMVDSAVSFSKKQGAAHITILLHLFRDGNSRHIGTTEKIVKYLVYNLNLCPITLRQMKDKYADTHDSVSDRLLTFDHAQKKFLTGKILLPSTAQDFVGFFENFVFVRKRLHEDCAVY